MATATTLELNAIELTDTLEWAMTARQPVWIWGGPGIGKSQVVAQVAARHDAALIDIRLGSRQPAEVRGIPFFNKFTNTMEWCRSDIIPTKEFCSLYKLVILFLDELSNANTMVQQACYQLINERRLGEFELADNVVIIAAGNRQTDNGGSFKVLSPLANRFLHLHMRVDANLWIDHAMDNGFHPSVIGFITAFKADLNTPDVSKVGLAFPTPRTVERVSKMLMLETTNGYGVKSAPSEKVLGNLVAGLCGDGWSAKFMAHYKQSFGLPEPEKVLDGTITTFAPDTPDETSVRYGFVVSLVQALSTIHEKGENKAFYAAADKFFEFIVNNYDTKAEIAVVAGRMVLKRFKSNLNPKLIPGFTKFTSRWGKMIARSMGAETK